MLSSFNPRTHEGCNPGRRIQARCRVRVSIHAPMKGAPPPKRTSTRSARSFNPRTHEGCDVRMVRMLTRTVRSFNPRTHEGCDRSAAYATSSGWCFNPRTHEGCDWSDNLLDATWTSFNPRTHEGCDGCHRPGGCRNLQVSIHAPMKGATRAAESRVAACFSFNPRTHEGCDVANQHDII